MFRSGGKPPEDSAVKSSGAKFICRSHARPIGNAYPSTATSSTTPIGTNIGKLIGHIQPELSTYSIRTNEINNFSLDFMEMLELKMKITLTVIPTIPEAIFIFNATFTYFS